MRTTKTPDDRDMQMILDAREWPAWPFLPLKRRNNALRDHNLGLLLADEQHDKARRGQGKFIVYHVYMFDPPKGREAWDAAPRSEYDNAQALLQDEWVVD